MDFGKDEQIHKRIQVPEIVPVENVLFSEWDTQTGSRE